MKEYKKNAQEGPNQEVDWQMGLVGTDEVIVGNNDPQPAPSAHAIEYWVVAHEQLELQNLLEREVTLHMYVTRKSNGTFRERITAFYINNQEPIFDHLYWNDICSGQSTQADYSHNYRRMQNNPFRSHS